MTAVGIQLKQRNPALSALISALLTLLLIGIGQFFKSQLAASRQGNLIAGGLFCIWY